MRAEPRPRPGLVLLEVLVALTIVAVGITAMISLAAESYGAVAHTDAAERAVRRADGFMQDVALWPRADLDRHLGDRPEGPWRLRVDRPLLTLYVVSLTDSASGRILLATSFYRSQVSDDAP